MSDVVRSMHTECTVRGLLSRGRMPRRPVTSSAPPQRSSAWESPLRCGVPGAELSGTPRNRPRGSAAAARCVPIVRTDLTARLGRQAIQRIGLDGQRGLGVGNFAEFGLQRRDELVEPVKAPKPFPADAEVRETENVVLPRCLEDFYRLSPDVRVEFGSPQCGTVEPAASAVLMKMSSS